MKILFVCTGNTCRSPMASAIFSHRLKSRNIQLSGEKVEIRSAGLCALEGGPASLLARQAMEEIGLDISNHRATSVHSELIQAADLILTMTGSQKEFLLDFCDEPDLPVYTLAEYVGEEAMEVQDPFGRDMEAYRATLKQLNYLVDRLLQKIIESD